MSYWTTFKSWFSRKRKVKAWPNWTPIGGGGQGGTDFWGRADPTSHDLVKAFNDNVYNCATLISDKISTVPIRLYVRTDKGQARPKCHTRPISRKTLDYLRNNKRAGYSTHIEEVSNHPLLELFNHCNSEHNFLDLIQLTQLSMDVTGNAFWYLSSGEYEQPGEIYLLPAQQVSPIRSDAGYIIGWVLNNGQHETEYPVDKVIHFKYPSLVDPYGLGVGPVAAAWNRVQLGFKELGYLDALVSNSARPDAILSPDESISPFESERLAKDFFQRYRGQGNGGIFVADGPMKLTPLNFPPRDMAELEIYKNIKFAVSNAFHIPPDVWELGQTNRSSSEAVLYALAVHCIQPRLARIVEKINERLVPLYSDRLFFEADSPVPEDKEFLLQERQMLVQTGTITRNENRQLYGFDSAKWATVPLSPPGSLPTESLMPQEQDVPLPEPEQDRTALAPAIATMQAQVQAGQIDRLAAIANVMLTMDFTQAQAQALFPEPAKPIQAEPIQAEPTKSKKRKKSHKLKGPDRMAEALQSFFRRQKTAIVTNLKSLDDVQTKSLGDNWFDVEHWTREMAESMRPTVALYYEDSSKATVSRIGASLDLLKVVQPSLKASIDKATFKFCEETQRTTSLEIGTAVKQLKESLHEGMMEGQYGNQLAKRVGDIFEDAEQYRSWRIAVTEANRSQHSAQEITAKESGLVSGKRWLLSSEACELCQPLADKVVPLGENFIVDPAMGPYAEVPFPPRHCNCRCTMTEVMEGIN